MAEALGQHRLQAVVVRPAGEHLLADDAPRWIRARRAIGEWIRYAGRRVERDVRVVLQHLLVAAARVDVIRLDRHVGGELTLEADRGLPVVREMRVLGLRRLFGRRAVETAGRVV